MLTDSGMTIILPTDQALEQVYPEPNIGDEDPFVANMPLARQLVTDHIILQVNTLSSNTILDIDGCSGLSFQDQVPQAILDKIKQNLDKPSISGRTITFTPYDVGEPSQTRKQA